MNISYQSWIKIYKNLVIYHEQSLLIMNNGELPLRTPDSTWNAIMTTSWSIIIHPWSPVVHDCSWPPHSMSATQWLNFRYMGGSFYLVISLVISLSGSANLGIVPELSGALQSTVECCSCWSMGPGLWRAPESSHYLCSTPCCSGTQWNFMCWQQ